MAIFTAPIDAAPAIRIFARRSGGRQVLLIDGACSTPTDNCLLVPLPRRPGTPVELRAGFDSPFPRLEALFPRVLPPLGAAPWDQAFDGPGWPGATRAELIDDVPSLADRYPGWSFAAYHLTRGAGRFLPIEVWFDSMIEGGVFVPLWSARGGVAPAEIERRTHVFSQGCELGVESHTTPGEGEAPYVRPMPEPSWPSWLQGAALGPRAAAPLPGAIAPDQRVRRVIFDGVGPNTDVTMA